MFISDIKQKDGILKWLHTFLHQETEFTLLIYKNHLKKSMKLIKQMNEIAEKGGKVLFVGTKKTSQEAVKEEAIRSEVFMLTHVG